MKSKNIHILPTDKPSRIRIGDNGNFVIGLAQNATVSKNDSYTNRNIYITSDEEIKEGDSIFETDTNTINIVGKHYVKNKLDFKIILTTDQDLIKDGVQAIDDEFLEWFVNNPSCEEVEVKEKQHFEADKSKRKNPLNGVYYSYKIIIPTLEQKLEKIVSKEPSKFWEESDERVKEQETLEEATEINCESITHPYCDREKAMFIKGAKWQAERMYSEEEVLQILYKHTEDLLAGKKITLEEWFKQFRK